MSNSRKLNDILASCNKTYNILLDKSTRRVSHTCLALVVAELFFQQWVRTRRPLCRALEDVQCTFCTYFLLLCILQQNHQTKKRNKGSKGNACERHEFSFFQRSDWSCQVTESVSLSALWDCCVSASSILLPPQNLIPWSGDLNCLLTYRNCETKTQLQPEDDSGYPLHEQWYSP